MEYELIPDAQVESAMLFWLLFGTQDDRYEPESAALLLAALHSLDDESAAVTITLYVMDVRLEVN